MPVPRTPLLSRLILLAALIVTGVPGLAAPLDQPTREKAVEILRQGLKANETAVKLSAASALVWNGYDVEDAHDVLRSLAEQGTGVIQIEAWSALAGIENDARRRRGLVEEIRPAIRDSLADVRSAALASLAQLGDPEVLQLAEEDEGALVVVLSFLENPPEHLVEKAHSIVRNVELRDLSVETLAVEVHGKPQDREDFLGALANLVGDATAVAANRAFAVESLGRFGTEAQLGSLVSALDDSDAHVRVAAANAVLRISRRVRRPLASLDWFIIALYGLGLLGVGWYFARRTKTSEDYLLGGRRMRSAAVGLSLFASLLSTISYLAGPGEMLRYGPLYLGGIVALPFAATFAGWLVIPTIMKLRVTSAYEILELRLGPSVRTLGSILFLALRFIWMAVIVFTTTSQVLVPMLNLDPSWTPAVCAVLGLITVVYTSMGGFQAVVWTDVLQTVILFGGALLSIVIVTVEMGGVSEWWPQAWATHWPEPVWGLDTSARVSLVAISLATFTWYICTTASDQMAIQRYLATRDAKTARRVLFTSMTTDATVSLFLGGLGLALLAYYRSQPHMVPDGPGLLARSDQLLPRFIVFALPAGVTGLVVAGLLAAAMSSLSSGLNSSSSVITVDFLARFRREPLSDAKRVRWAKSVSVAVGLLVVGLAAFVNMIEGNIFELTHKTSNLLVAPLAGLFFVAIFMPWATTTATLIGAGCSLTVVVLIAFWKDFTGSTRGISFLWAMPLGLLAQLVVAAGVSLVSWAVRRKS